MESEMKKPTPQPKPIRKRRWLFWSTFALTILLFLTLHRCYQAPVLQAPSAPISSSTGTKDSSIAPPLDSAPIPEPRTPNPIPIHTDIPKPKPVEVPTDSSPYLYANPWGGRHFDSVQVELFCRGNCVVLYSVTDSINFKTYEAPLTFRRNTVLWISAADSLARQVHPIRIEYTIEKDPGFCRRGMMPVKLSQGEVCVDIYEWPNQEGELPQASINQMQATDSCKKVGKHLCSLEEWQSACHGPENDNYPYTGKYNEKHCTTKDNQATRSGRSPACRSYYGNRDMTGNLWEWTSTPAPQEDFFLVAGGNWSTGPEATCSLRKYSFYPQNRYPFVGFRCCEEIEKK
jgi:hypothetical protein